MAIVRHRKKWLVRVRDRDGKWFPARSFERKVDAQKYENELELRKSENISAPDSSVKQLSFENYFCLWFQECRSEVSDGWKQSQIQCFRDHIKPFIGDKRFLEISKRDIALVLSHAKDKGLASQTRAHIYNLLHKMFEDAVHHFEFVTFNPVIRRYKPKVYQKERNFLQSKEAWKLLNSTRSTWLGPPVWVSLFCATRPCELQALKWSQVDWNHRRIIINSAYKRKEKRLEDFPKQGDWGQAPIPEALFQFLNELEKLKRTEEFVAPGPNGGMLNYDSFLRALQRHCREIGITVVTPHELRHSATELYYTAGASTEDLKRLLNHSSVKTTETYIHRTTERLQQIAGQIKTPEVSLKLVK